MKKFEGVCRHCLKDRGEMCVFLDEKLLGCTRNLSELKRLSPNIESEQYAHRVTTELASIREITFSQRLQLEIDHLKDGMSREIYGTRKEERGRAQKIIEELDTSGGYYTDSELRK